MTQDYNRARETLVNMDSIQNIDMINRQLIVSNPAPFKVQENVLKNMYLTRFENNQLTQDLN